MWFFVAVLILWGMTATMARWDPWVLAPIAQWTWWTFHLCVCGVAATTERFLGLAEKIMGLFGFCLVVIYYRTMADTYMQFVPSNEDHPDLWAAIFMVVNLLGPLVLITVGVLSTTVQRRGEG